MYVKLRMFLGKAGTRRKPVIYDPSISTLKSDHLICGQSISSDSGGSLWLLITWSEWYGAQKLKCQLKAMWLMKLKLLGNQLCTCAVYSKTLFSVDMYGSFMVKKKSWNKICDVESQSNESTWEFVAFSFLSIKWCKDERSLDLIPSQWQLLINEFWVFDCVIPFEQPR